MGALRGQLRLRIVLCVVVLTAVGCSKRRAEQTGVAQAATVAKPEPVVAPSSSAAVPKPPGLAVAFLHSEKDERLECLQVQATNLTPAELKARFKLKGKGETLEDFRAEVAAHVAKVFKIKVGKGSAWNELRECPEGAWGACTQKGMIIHAYALDLAESLKGKALRPVENPPEPHPRELTRLRARARRTRERRLN